MDLYGAIHEAIPAVDRLWAVDNGSTDDSASFYLDLKVSGAHFVRIDPNRRYGGGMAEAIRVADTDVVCLLPGDNQYSAEDVIAVLDAYLSLEDSGGVMAKGRRETRDDPLQVRALSAVYSTLGRLILGIGRIDANGLPKVFDRRPVLSMIDALPNDAVFDAALCSVWKRAGGTIREYPVTFRNRVHGQPSWNGGKFAVGWAMFKSLRESGHTLRRNFRSKGEL